jgi:hypothetical protein
MTRNRNFKLKGALDIVRFYIEIYLHVIQN